MTFAPPRLEKFGPVILAGVQKSHRLGRERMEVYSDIAAQWRGFVAVAAPIPAIDPPRGYGFALPMADGATALAYFCGFVVSGRSQVPTGFATFEIPLLTVAVFEHREHLSLMRATIELIFSTVLPMAGIEPADEAPVEFIQRYTEGFDPTTGRGGIEVLVPVKV